jgi:hypothetical protein
LTDPGVLEGLSAEVADELRMFLAHFAAKRADGRIAIEINIHDGRPMNAWIGGRRLEIASVRN